MDTTEHWEAKEAMLEQISAALSFAEDQLEDLLDSGIDIETGDVNEDGWVTRADWDANRDGVIDADDDTNDDGIIDADDYL